MLPANVADGVVSITDVCIGNAHSSPAEISEKPGFRWSLSSIGFAGVNSLPTVPQNGKLGTCEDLESSGWRVGT